MQRANKSVHLALGALAVAMAASPVALAESKSFPGTMCNASGSQQDLFYGSFLIANRQSSARSAICPIVRENVGQPWIAISVHVWDRSSIAEVCCTVQADDVFAIAGGGWSEEKCTSGEGTQVLGFGPPQTAVPFWGPYVVTCQLPAMEEPNQPSMISSYQILEP